MQPNRAVLSVAFLISLAGAVRSATEGIPAVVSLSDLSADTGLRIIGANEYDFAGMSVASIGDINGDGLSDLLVGAYYAETAESVYPGAAFVVFGKPAGETLPASINLGTLGEDDGFRINGIQSEDLAGGSVAAIGDVNDDNINDFAIGARVADPNAIDAAGETYIIFGRRSDNPFPQTLELTDLNGTEGLRIQGFQEDQRSGYSIAGGFDINGDKIDDIVIGAPRTDLKGAEDVGEAYVVFGRRRTVAFPATLSLDALDGTNGFRISDEREYDGAARSVAIAADVNGDKLPDIIIGAGGFDLKGTGGAGAVHVVYGRKANNPFLPLVELQSLNAAVDGFRIEGSDENGAAGISVAAGDINGDKISDIIFSAPFTDVDTVTDAGVVHVVFGRKKNNPFSTVLSTADLDGTNGFRVTGIAEDDRIGTSLAVISDINADKVNDLAIGANSTDLGAGSVSIVFGRKTTSFPSVLALADLNGSNGFRITGVADSAAGFSLSSAPDINRDSRADFLIGAPFTDADPAGRVGEAIVFYAPAPEVNVELDASNVANASTIDLGEVDLGSPLSLEFTIQNTGFAELTLQNVKVPRGFVTLNPAPASLESLDDATLEYTITPTRAGDFSGKVSFKTNDSNEKKFSFTLNWTVNPVMMLASGEPAPRIDVDTIADLNADWVTNTADLLLMLRAQGTTDASADLNADDRIDSIDLQILLTQFGGD